MAGDLPDFEEIGNAAGKGAPATTPSIPDFEAIGNAAKSAPSAPVQPAQRPSILRSSNYTPPAISPGIKINGQVVQSPIDTGQLLKDPIGTLFGTPLSSPPAGSASPSSNVTIPTSAALAGIQGVGPSTQSVPRTSAAAQQFGGEADIYPLRPLQPLADLVNSAGTAIYQKAMELGPGASAIQALKGVNPQVGKVAESVSQQGAAALNPVNWAGGAIGALANPRAAVSGIVEGNKKMFTPSNQTPSEYAGNAVGTLLTDLMLGHGAAEGLGKLKGPVEAPKGVAPETTPITPETPVAPTPESGTPVEPPKVTGPYTVSNWRTEAAADIKAAQDANDTIRANMPRSTRGGRWPQMDALRIDQNNEVISSLQRALDTNRPTAEMIEQMQANHEASGGDTNTLTRNLVQQHLDTFGNPETNGDYTDIVKEMASRAKGDITPDMFRHYLEPEDAPNVDPSQQFAQDNWQELAPTVKAHAAATDNAALGSAVDTSLKTGKPDPVLTNFLTEWHSENVEPSVEHFNALMTDSTPEEVQKAADSVGVTPNEFKSRVPRSKGKAVTEGETGGTTENTPNSVANNDKGAPHGEGQSPIAGTEPTANPNSTGTERVVVPVATDNASTPSEPSIASVKPEAPLDDVTGLARQIEDKARVDRGLEPLPTKGVTLPDMLAKGETLRKSGEVDPAKVIRMDRAPTNDEAAAIAHYQREVANRSKAIEDELAKGPSVLDTERLKAEQAHLLNEMDLIDKASRKHGAEWHEGGMIRQLALKPDYSLQGLTRKALAANAGVPLRDQVKALVAKHAETINKLQSQLDELKKSAAEIDPATLEPKAKSAAIDRIRKMIGDEPGTTARGMASSKRGAIDLDALGATQRSQLQIDVRSLAKNYIANGAKSPRDIARAFARDFPGLSEDNVFDLLSKKYATVREQLTAEQLAANQTMNALGRYADWRNKTVLQKTMSAAWESLNGLSRNANLAGHLSAPFMQGRKVLLADPTAWLKSWKPMIQGYIGGDQAANMQMARFMNDPAWEKAKDAEFDKVLAKPHGKLTEMEESLAADISNKIPVLGKVFEHSGAAFNGFLNEARWQMFKSALKVSNDPQYLNLMAKQIGTLTGRSISDLAQNPTITKTGAVLFSPRYTISKWEFSSGKPLMDAVKAGNPAAIKQIAKQYAMVVGGTMAIQQIAQRLYGAQTDNDPRSTNFGHTTVGNNVVDLYGQEGEPYKVLAKMFAGSVSAKGKEAGPMGLNEVSNYLKNKLTKPAQIPLDLATGGYNAQGQMTNPAIGKQSGNKPPFDYANEAESMFAPISVKGPYDELQKGADLAPFLSPLGIMTKAKEK